MGNTTYRSKNSNPKSIEKPEEIEEEGSSISITNYSANSNSLGGSLIISQKSISTSDISLFSWDRLQSLYNEIIRKTSNSTELQPHVVMVLKDLFNAISNNIFQMSHDFNSSVLDTDNGHQNYFDECASRNLNSHTKSLNSKDKIRNHIFSTFHLHMKILNHMTNGNYDEVHNILQLIGVSHALMKVDPNYFKTMDVAMGKFLIGNKLLTESNAEYTVIYFNYVTSYIINYMNLQYFHDDSGTENITDDQHSTIVRENYRNMKKWYKLVKSIQEEVIQMKEPETFAKQSIAETSSSLSTVPTEILAQDACILKYFIKKKDTINEIK